MGKLTLNVDQRVVSRAKRYARKQGVSVSQMVGAYLDAVAEPTPVATPNAPILRSLKGVLKKANSIDDDEYTLEHSRDYWAYLKTGILIDSSQAGLIHYNTPEVSFELIERRSDAG